jgi:hypothetical protein
MTAIEIDFVDNVLEKGGVGNRSWEAGGNGGW